jgi:hypothetical protein
VWRAAEVAARLRTPASSSRAPLAWHGLKTRTQCATYPVENGLASWQKVMRCCSGKRERSCAYLTLNVAGRELKGETAESPIDQRLPPSGDFSRSPRRPSGYGPTHGHGRADQIRPKPGLGSGGWKRLDQPATATSAQPQRCYATSDNTGFIDRGLICLSQPPSAFPIFSRQHANPQF